MDIGIILSAFFVPACVMSVFSAIQTSHRKTSKTMSDKHFVIMLPKTVLVIGIVGDLMFAGIVLGFTLFSGELPHIVFYIVFGLFFWFGTYLVLKTLKFRVIVKGEKITVCSVFIKPYTFTFSEIVSAVRQVKRNQVKSERIVVKTVSGRRLVVESTEISYKRFLQRVKSEVKSEHLFGFE